MSVSFKALQAILIFNHSWGPSDKLKAHSQWEAEPTLEFQILRQCSSFIPRIWEVPRPLAIWGPTSWKTVLEEWVLQKSWLLWGQPLPSLSFFDSKTRAQTAKAQGTMGDSDASCFLGHSDRGMETARAWVHGLREGPWREKEAEQWGQLALRCGRSELGSHTGWFTGLVGGDKDCLLDGQVSKGREDLGSAFLKCSQIEGEICSSTSIFGWGKTASWEAVRVRSSTLGAKDPFYLIQALPWITV